MERNPWDEIPCADIAGKPVKLEKPVTQMSLASCLRSNILSGQKTAPFSGSTSESPYINLTKSPLFSSKSSSKSNGLGRTFGQGYGSSHFSPSKNNQTDIGNSNFIVGDASLSTSSGCVPPNSPQVNESNTVHLHGVNIDSDSGDLLLLPVFKKTSSVVKRKDILSKKKGSFMLVSENQENENTNSEVTDLDIQGCRTSIKVSPIEVSPRKPVVKKTGSLGDAASSLADVFSEERNFNASELLTALEEPFVTTTAEAMVVDPNPLLLTPSASYPGTSRFVGIGGVSIPTRSRATPSGNYLKLNLRKKCFSRAGTSRQARGRFQLKRAKFARRFGSCGALGKGKCFRCGQGGHWASKCPKSIAERGVQLTQKEIDEMDPDCSQVDWRIADLDVLKAQFPDGPQLSELLNGDSDMSVSFIDLNASLPLIEVRAYIKESLNQMGLKQFRPGQERVIMRTIFGKSTLLVLPTASGKSLCYQIPAAVLQKFYPISTALVISPLISLMQDQILSSTSPIRGAYLSSAQTREEKEQILSEIKNGHYAYVLMSPEALVESDWILRQNQLPPVSFVCVDEAHCLADWSHHFRPSYLQICNLLRTRLGVRHFLGLSATCTPSTIVNICHNLGITGATKLDSGEFQGPAEEPDGGYIQPILNPIPTNLLITASMDYNREEALIALLRRPPFSEQVSILIYAATRDLTERLAGYIRTSLQDVREKVGRRTVGWNTAVYHAGLTSKERERVQKRFMSGKVRVLVATSAFGMGLNKQDLQAVIHFSLPRSFENYIQEIGRVGRNGQQSYCHTFLPPGFSSLRSCSGSENAIEEGELMETPNAAVITLEEAREANELRRYIFANHIDSVQLKRLLHRYLAAVTSTEAPSRGKGAVVALDPEEIAEELDIKPESLATIASYMYLRTDAPPLVTPLPAAPMKVVLNCYGGPRELARVSTRCLAVSAWLAHLHSQSSATAPLNLSTLREVTIDLVALCNTFGWRPDAVFRELRALEWDSPAPGQPPRRTGVTVAVSGAARALWFWVDSRQQLMDRLDDELVYLRHRLQGVERAGLSSLAQLQSAIALVAVARADDIDFSKVGAGEEVWRRSQALHTRVQAHFCETLDERSFAYLSWPPPITQEKEASVRRTVDEFMQLYGASLRGAGESQVTGRVLANILHGIGSPNFPALAWSRAHRFWRAHLDVDWPHLQRIATQELVASQAGFT